MNSDSSGQCPYRVGLFTHSTHPRGGVVHAIELGESLASLGHDVVVHAPDESGHGFFRRGMVGQTLIPAEHVSSDPATLVRHRIKEYLDYLRPRGREFDIYHAHDGISGNALATLAEEGVIPGFVRTVHHLDDYAEPFLNDTQDRSIATAARVLCVSKIWAERLAQKYGIEAGVVPNGVDTNLFHPQAHHSDEQLLARVMGSDVVGVGPLFLGVGGIERRKNTINILRAFLNVRKSYPRAMLLIIGGADQPDHLAYRDEFQQTMAAEAGEAARSVIVTGPLPDELVAAAYRMSDALVFPSVTEGFGLAVLEAMASGTPVIASRLAPFTEYLTDHDALLVDPDDVGAIAKAMERAVGRSLRDRLRQAGFAVAGRFTWLASARAHLIEYRKLLKTEAGTLAAAGAVAG